LFVTTRRRLLLLCDNEIDSLACLPDADRNPTRACQIVLAMSFLCPFINKNMIRPMTAGIEGMEDQDWLASCFTTYEDYDCYFKAPSLDNQAVPTLSSRYMLVQTTMPSSSSVIHLVRKHPTMSRSQNKASKHRNYNDHIHEQPKASKAKAQH